MVEAWGLVALFVTLLAVACVVLCGVVALVARAGPAAVRVAGWTVALVFGVVGLVVVLVVFGPADLAQVLEAVAAARG